MDNPYDAPTAEIAHAAPAGTGDVSPRIMQAMEQTRPWVTLLSVLGFLVSGLMVVIAGGMLVAGGMGSVPGWVGLIYLPFAAMYAVPSVLLFRYRSAITTLTDGGGIPALEDTLERQKSFWKFVGVAALLVAGIYGLAVAGIAGAAIIGAL